MTDFDRRQRLITSTPHLTPEEIATRSFGKGVRGYAESEVRAFLKRVADELVTAQDRERELEVAIDALEEQLREPRPLTEQELLDALGEETARLLRSAREAGDEIRRKADEHAATVRADAEGKATNALQEIDEHVTRRRQEIEAVAADTATAAEARAQALADATVAEAEKILEAARQQGREMIEEAKSARERVLVDLVRRRALLNAQIEQLRVGRDRLLDAYRTVKRTFLDATEALAQVEGRAAEERAHAPEPLDIAEQVSAEIDALEGAHEQVATEEPTQLVDLSAAEAAERVDDDGQDTDETRRALADVDSLFARIRAGHDDGGAAPEAAEAPGAVATMTEAPAPAPEAEAEPEAPANEAQPEPEPEPEAKLTVEEWRDLRADAIDPLLPSLVKKAKRTAQDDQNALLDAVRRHKGRPTAAQVLPDLDALLAAWGDVLRDAVDHAYGAGRAVAGGEIAPADGELVREAADAVVAPLRLRVSVAIDSGEEGDTGGLVERIGARYREWKNQSLERALGEVLAFVWSRGVYDAVPEDSVLWWVPLEEGRCSDCDDNGLEPTTKASAFPTGQVHPPAHPGCRCLLAPADLIVAPTAGA
jgi:DivIVA domain-containing protein